MDRNDGGPALVCDKNNCLDSAHHYQGHQHLCSKHYRFGQMRATAKRRGLAVPCELQLEKLIPIDMGCGDCDRPMNWLAKHGQETVLTLQHYRDGSLGFACRSCNTRHAYAPGDSYVTEGPDKKRCPQCTRFLPRNEFCLDSGRTGSLKNKSWCRTCSTAHHKEWVDKNREKYNAKRKIYYHQRIAEGRPIPR